MKTRISRICLFASLGAATLVALGATAQTPASSTTTTTTAAPTDAAPAKLPYGVDDVLKLSRAQVSEDVTLNFIRNSGTIYNLAPKDIVYLRNEGVSDHVISTMLDQRKNVPAAPQAPVYPDANPAAAAQAPAQYAPTYAQPAPTYVQPDTAYAPPSTVYTIPYSTPAYPYYNGDYPYYYGGYPYYCGPSIGIGLGFGYGGYGYGGFRGGGFHGGGYRGGGYRGGGFHGGGSHGGGFGGGGHGGHH